MLLTVSEGKRKILSLTVLCISYFTPLLCAVLFTQKQEKEEEKRRAQCEAPECILSSEVWTHKAYCDIYVELIRKIIHQALVSLLVTCTAAKPLNLYAGLYMCQLMTGCFAYCSSLIYGRVC